MKKVLLATTAISMLAAGSAMAEPTVTVGGYADFQFGSASQDGSYEHSNPTGAAANNAAFSRGHHTRTDTEVTINVDGKTDNGLGYGAYIELEADVNAPEDAGGANNNAERGYVYLESAYGRVEAGPNTSATEALKVDASTFARATGGIGGDFYNYVDLDGQGTAAAGNATTGTADTFIITPDLPTSGFPVAAVGGTQPLNNREVLATANKLTYYSPRIQGIQLGVSYTPDLLERGTGTSFSGSNGTTQTSLENIWNVGLNYQGQYNGLGVDASATGEWGQSEQATRDDLRAYNLGLSLNYAGATVGGSWADLSEYGQVKTQNEDARFWTLGAAYEFGPFAASVSYLDSQIKRADAGTVSKDFNNVVVGADYQLAPGLVPYVEVAFFDTNDHTTDVDNDGTVFLLGTELNF